MGIAGFEDHAVEAAEAGFLLEAVEDGGGDAAAAEGRANVHAFELGQAVVEGNAAAADGCVVEPGDEEEDVGLEDARQA